MKSWFLFHPQNKKRADPPSQAPSPNAEGSARIAANVACATHFAVPDVRDVSDLAMVVRPHRQSQRLSQDVQNLTRQARVLEQGNSTIESTVHASQEELQFQKAEWTKQVVQNRNEINRLQKKEEQLRLAYEKESQDQKAEWTKREIQNCDEINRLQDTQKRLRQSYEESQNQNTEWKKRDTEWAKRDTEWTKRDVQNRNEISRLQNTEKQLRQQSQNQKAEWTKRDVQHRNEINRLQDTQNRQRQGYEEKIGKIQLEHTDRETALRARHEEEERRMREEHEAAVRELEDEIQTLRTNAEKREHGFNLEKMQLEEAHKVKQDELQERHKTDESKLKLAQKQQQERLTKDIQSRNKALIAREKYSPITDGELRSMFFGLVREVDALARLKWTLNRSKWSDELLSQISDTPKRLQKQILKDTTWEILFQHVFCSPFRVFGEEGIVLESQWNKAFGKDPETGSEHYIWPEPSFDAERWRYETMKQGQEALKIETSEFDPRTKLRKGVHSSIKIICEQLGEELELVSKIDERIGQTMKELAEKAARICVAFGTQRCRIFVVMKDLKTIEEVKEGPDRQGGLVELLTQPELRRIGDAEGQSLDKKHTVAGCEGEMKKFLY